MSEPCVVYLVRGANGLERFETFLESYDRHPAGEDHELVVVFKGLDTGDAAPYLELAGGRLSDAVFVDDSGRDLTAYFAAAARLRRDRYCFLNSFSEIAADGWLAMLDSALADPAVGIAGATGSWASSSSYARYRVGLGGPYARVFENRAQTQAAMERHSSPPEPVAPRSLGGRLLDVAELPARLWGFDPFPNRHVRTNAFVVTSETFLRLRRPRAGSKIDGLRLESGRRSITRQIERLGLHAVLVTRDGVSHHPPDWAASGAFWQRDQDSLLVADNQTRAYDRGDAEVRRLLSRYAWGEWADPGESTRR